MKGIKHIFFDLDHTLWDFESNSKAALHEIFEAEQLVHKGIPSFETFIEAYQNINKRYWDLYREGKMTKERLRVGRFLDTLLHFELNDKPLALKMGDDYVNISPRKTNLFPHTLEVLEYLKNNNYCLHIITNGFSEVQYTKLENSKLKPFFDEIITSEQVGVKKPDPKIFHYSLETARSIANESLMIGDEPEIDIKGALDVGMKGFVFNPKKEKQHNYEEITCLSELKVVL